MTRFLMILLFALSGVGRAEVTAAWKVPIGHFVPDHENNAKVRKLEKPPGESGFFQQGDELWDVSGALIWDKPVFDEGGTDPFELPVKVEKIPWKGEWIVWNARSGMFVARGTWEEIRHVEEVLEFQALPIVLRSRLSLVEGREGGDDKPGLERSISVVSRSGEKAAFGIDGMKSEIEATAHAKDGLSDVSISLVWPGAIDQSEWKVATTVAVEESKSIRIARHGTGAGAWELFLNTSRELCDGTPKAEARWMEWKGAIIPWIETSFGGRMSPRERVDQNRWVAWYSPGFHGIVDLDGSDGNVAEIDAPSDLAKWARGTFIDVSGWLKTKGIDTSAPGFFAGYDPVAARTFLAAGTEAHDFYSELALGESIGAKVWIESNAASGSWGLACRSGEKAGIALKQRDQEDLVFEIEPTIGNGSFILDLRYRCDAWDGKGKRGRLQSAATMLSGTSLEVGRYKPSSGDEIPVVFTGTILGFSK